MVPESPNDSDRVSICRCHLQAVERVIGEMRSRFNEPLCLDELARTAHLSRYHFDRVFRKTTGISPMQFLYALRIESAKFLLFNSARRVIDICYEVGYNSLGTFTYRFTQFVGLPPTSFRRIIKREGDILLPTLLESKTNHFEHNGVLPAANGRIESTIDFDGLVFVGAFKSRLPQGRPGGGTVLLSPGRYSLESLEDGRYCILAAGFPRSNNAISYWLPQSSSLFVGVGTGVVTVSRGEVTGDLNLTLRPASAIDPPILVALPALVQRLRFSAQGS